MREFVRARVVDFSDDNQISLFDNGRDGLAAMLDDIRCAQKSVYLETYILRSDSTGQRFLSALEERASAGLDVRLIFDAVGSHSLDRRQLQPLKGAGGRVVAFNPLGRSIRKRILRRRDHRKLLIIDGRVGFVGGLNIGDEYAAEVAGRPAWRDAHARVEGASVPELTRLFAATWARCSGSGAGPPRRRNETLALKASGDIRSAVLADGPTYRRRRMRLAVISALAGVQDRVLLVSPYFAPGRGVLDALDRAARRGVRIEVVMAGRSDHPIFRRAARAFVPRLLKSGVRVFEDPERMMHAKVAAFDDDLSIIGTSNLDRQSLEHSYEVNLLVEGRTTAAWIREHFGPTNTNALAIDDEALMRRSWLARLIDRIAWFLVRLL